MAITITQAQCGDMKKFILDVIICFVEALLVYFFFVAPFAHAGTAQSTYTTSEADAKLDIIPAPAALVGNAYYLVRTNAAGTAFEVVNSFSAALSAFDPDMILVADENGVVGSHYSVDAVELHNAADGATGNHEARIYALEQGGAGGDTVVITAGPETANEIVVGLQMQRFGVPYSMTALLRVWLSATAGGVQTTAFDSWTLSDAVALDTFTASVDYNILTGTGGDATVTLGDADAVTKFLNVAFGGTVSSSEIIFSSEASPCTVSTEHLNWVVGNQNFYGSPYIAQKMDFTSGSKTFCKLDVALTNPATTSQTVHFELWSAGTSDAGATMSGDSAQIGGDSESIALTADGAEHDVQFLWAANPVGTGYPFLHLVNETGTAIVSWKADGNQELYKGNAIDLWVDGADVSADAVFRCYFGE